MILSEVPESIDWPANVILQGSLSSSTASVDALDITGYDVTLDLNGHEIVGSVGTGSGINVDRIGLEGPYNVEIRNGTIRNFGEYGIFASLFTKNIRVLNVRVRGNSLAGIRLRGPGNLVKDCMAVNAGDGIDLSNIGHGSIITGNVATENGGNGIVAGDSNTVTGNIASANTGAGIVGGFRNTITGNTVTDNEGTGISTSGSSVTGNTVSSNNQSDNVNGAGISINQWTSLVRGNTLWANLQNNISVNAFDCAIEENLVVGSTNGINFIATGCFYANNRASGNTTNFTGNVPAGAGDGGGNAEF